MEEKNLPHFFKIFLPYSSSNKGFSKTEEFENIVSLISLTKTLGLTKSWQLLTLNLLLNSSSVISSGSPYGLRKNLGNWPRKLTALDVVLDLDMVRNYCQ